MAMVVVAWEMEAEVVVVVRAASEGKEGMVAVLEASVATEVTEATVVRVVARVMAAALEASEAVEAWEVKGEAGACSNARMRQGIGRPRMFLCNPRPGCSSTAHRPRHFPRRHSHSVAKHPHRC